MSDELKIELQVETDASKAKSQLNDLINEYKKKKPINLDVKINDSNLDGFRKSIKTITDDLSGLANIKFDNLNKVESSLKKIANLINNVQNSNKNTSTTTKSTQGTFVEAFGFVDDIDFERLSRNHSEALKQVKNLQQSAAYLKDGFKAYSDKVKEAHKAFDVDNSELLSKIDELENMYDSRTFKKLITARKQLNEVFKEYNSLGVKLGKDEHPFEAYNGDTWVNSNDKYIDQIGMSVDRYRQQVARAKQLTQEKNALLKKIKGYLYTNARDRVTEDEKIIYDLLSVNYDKIPDVNLSDANQIRDRLTKILQDDFFKLDLSNLDLQFEEDFEKAYNKVFEVLEEVQKEYNSKFKDIDGFKELDIFDVDSLSKQNEKLEKEVENTTNVLKTLSQIESGSLEKLGLDDNSFNIMKTLSNSADELEGKLVSLKEKFSNAFEISADSAKALERVREALLEINKLTDDQKQVFFDFGLDVENIKKTKDELEGLNKSAKELNDIDTSGLVESYSKITNRYGDILRETEKIRNSALKTVTLDYRYEENESGDLEKVLNTAKFTDEVGKRVKELVKEYKDASQSLAKVQKEYYQVLADDKSSENTINHLTKNVNKMQDELLRIRKNLKDELSGYDDVIDSVFEDFEKIDKIRHNQMTSDSLKIIDKAELSEANRLLKETEKLIDQISKNSIQLQKDKNAGYSTAVEGLEARIQQQAKQVSDNITSLKNISSAKAAVDQINSYRLDKAQKTQIEIARINDKANKNTGVKTVDEQDKFLKQYKDTLTQIKAITKSLAKESNGAMSAEKVLKLDKAYKELDEIKKKLNDVKKEAAEGLYNKAMSELDLSLANSFSKTVKELDKVEEKITKLGKSDYVDTNRIKVAESVIANLRNTLSKGLDNLDAGDLSKVLNTIEEIKTASKSIELNIKIAKDAEKIDNFIKSVTDRLELLGDVDISHINKQFKDLEAGSDRLPVVMKNITDDVTNLEKKMKKAGDSAGGLGKSFKNFFDDIGDALRTFTLGEIIGDVITDALQQTWDVIKEMDSAMANLKKVADTSDINSSEKLDNIRSQAIDVAKDVGMASTDVINAIADTLQAGVGGMEESIQVARSAMILANVGDMTQEAASSALNTIINGYKLDPLKQIDVQVGGLTQKTTELANAMDLLNYAG